MIVGEVNAMGPLIDAELERVDRKHAQLTQLSADLVEALGLYHTLMREPQLPAINKLVYESPYGYAEQFTLPPNVHLPPQSNMGYPMTLPSGKFLYLVYNINLYVI